MIDQYKAQLNLKIQEMSGTSGSDLSSYSLNNLGIGKPKLEIIIQELFAQKEIDTGTILGLLLKGKSSKSVPQISSTQRFLYKKKEGADKHWIP